MRISSFFSFFLLPFSVALLCLSCNTTSKNEPIAGPDFYTPVFTGLLITNANGPEIIGVWGNPSDSRSYDLPFPMLTGKPSHAVVHSVNPHGGIVPRQVGFFPAYPNPFEPLTQFQFELPQNMHASMWVVREYLPGEAPDVASEQGATLVAPQRAPLEVLLNDYYSAGSYLVQWDAAAVTGNAPIAYYRVFFSAGDFLAWHDVACVRDLNVLPPSVRELVQWH